MKTKFFCTSFLLLFFVLNSKCQIYNKEIVYTYNYSIKNGSTFNEGKIYLGCFGKIWPLKQQKQMAVIWTTDLKELADKIFNTGVIEDKDRIWLHPPRNGIFKILEYSPFPEIRFPVKLHKKWNWQLQLGNFWGNREYGLTAEDTIKYTYEIKENQQYLSPFLIRKLDCFKIYGVSTNIKNPTSFSGLYDINYGFTSMVFTNIDSSVITLELVSIDKWEKFTSKDNGFLHGQIYTK